MLFQLAVGGEYPKAPALLQTVRQWIERLPGQGERPRLQALVNPACTDEAWLPFLRELGADILCFAASGDKDWSDRCDRIVWEDTPLRSLVVEAMCDRADLVAAVWSEDVTERSGATWELIQTAHKERTPCLWASSKSGTAYWSEWSYFDHFQPETLERLCGDYRGAALEPAPGTGKEIPLLALGDRLRRRFLNKYRALRPETAPVEDRMLLEDFSLEREGAGAEPVRQRILAQFRRFDQAAVTLNARYQAVIYWRTILPFLATVFLAVGFYAETLLSVTGMPDRARSILAGTGFLIHGLLNLYVYFLSKDSTVKEDHTAFLQNRYVAEVLRVLIHFVPYGVYPDLRGMCAGSDKTRAALQNIILGEEPEVQRVDGHSVERAAGHLKELLQDQLAYHKAAADRYQRISKRLERWAWWTFGVGLFIVIARAVLQFYVAFFPLEGTINGADLNSFVRSFANMAALLVPAWAGFFSTKESLCNFSFLYQNHSRMAEELTAALAQLESLEAIEGGVPLDVLNTLSEEIARTMIEEDTLVWGRKLKGSAVTHL